MTILPPKKAFVLAAGLGERMRPLTNECPKPLLTVGGKTMLDRVLDELAEVGVSEAVVNTFYLASMIEDHLSIRKFPKIVISRETELLDTGGGVNRMIDFFDDTPFYVLNADVVWTNGKKPTLTALADAWDSSKMDLLLLLYPLEKIQSYTGSGDYYLEERSDYPVFAKNKGKTANYVFAGPRIVHPRLFAGAPEGAFSFLKLFHKAEQKRRLRGLRHDGKWHHISTPEAFIKVNQSYNSN